MVCICAAQTQSSRMRTSRIPLPQYDSPTPEIGLWCHCLCISVNYDDAPVEDMPREENPRQLIQNCDCLCKLEWGMLWMLNSKNNKKAMPKVLEFMYCCYRCVIEWWSSSSNSWSFGSNFCAMEIYFESTLERVVFLSVIGVCPPPPDKVSSA